MPIAGYGLLKGTVIGHLRDADDDHYQILVRAGATLFRVATNVRSAAANAPSTVLFQTTAALPQAYTDRLRAAKPGFTKVASRPGGLAFDYLRSGVVKPASMKPLPPERPGADNDLKDLLEGAALKAMKEAGTLLYALGARWGPEKNRPDQYFRFAPGNGVHDIHMNQGSAGAYRKDNGVYQDGALFLEFPGGRWRGIFLAFQSQALRTDGRGDPV